MKKLIEQLSVPNRYANEEVASSYTYPKKYQRPKSIERQVELLLKHLPGLDPEPAFRFYRDVYVKLAFPEWVEGPFTLPSEAALTRLFFPDVTDPKEIHCHATNLILAKIGESREFVNCSEMQFTPDWFRLNARTARALDILAGEQQGDIWIVGGQFGKHHAGRSVRRAREVMVDPEFGAYTVAAGSMLLTHPERLVPYDELWFDVPGDEFDLGPGGSFDFAPYFFFDGGKAEFDACWVRHPDGRYGSVSLVLPQ